MGDVVLRNLDETTIAALRRRAAVHGRSLDEELAEIVRQATLPRTKAEALAVADAIRARSPAQTTDSTNLIREARDSR